MVTKSIKDELNSMDYHGRGIMIGKSADGKKAVTAYFIRSILLLLFLLISFILNILSKPLICHARGIR